MACISAWCCAVSACSVTGALRRNMSWRLRSTVEHHGEQAVHHLHQHQVVRGFGNGQVELRVGACSQLGVAALLMLQHHFKAALDVGFVLRGARCAASQAVLVSSAWRVSSTS